MTCKWLWFNIYLCKIDLRALQTFPCTQIDSDSSATSASRAVVAVQMPRRDLTVCVSLLLALRCGCWSSPALCLCQLDTSCQCLYTVSEGKGRLFCTIPDKHKFELKCEEFVWLHSLTRLLKLGLNFCFPGAALGRLLGEGVAYVSSTGGTTGQQWASINPGGYALAGRKTWSIAFGVDIVITCLCMQCLYPSLMNLNLLWMLY